MRRVLTDLGLLVSFGAVATVGNGVRRLADVDTRMRCVIGGLDPADLIDEGEDGDASAAPVAQEDLIDEEIDWSYDGSQERKLQVAIELREVAQYAVKYANIVSDDYRRPTRRDWDRYMQRPVEEREFLTLDEVFDDPLYEIEDGGGEASLFPDQRDFNPFDSLGSFMNEREMRGDDGSSDSDDEHDWADEIPVGFVSSQFEEFDDEKTILVIGMRRALFASSDLVRMDRVERPKLFERKVRKSIRRSECALGKIPARLKLGQQYAESMQPRRPLDLVLAELDGRSPAEKLSDGLGIADGVAEYYRQKSWQAWRESIKLPSLYECSDADLQMILGVDHDPDCPICGAGVSHFDPRASELYRRIMAGEKITREEITRVVAA